MSQFSPPLTTDGHNVGLSRSISASAKTGSASRLPACSQTFHTSQSWFLFLWQPCFEHYYSEFLSLSTSPGSLRNSQNLNCWSSQGGRSSDFSRNIDWKEAITWHVLVQRDSIGCAAWKHLILSTLPQVLFDFCYHSARVGLLFRDVCSFVFCRAAGTVRWFLPEETLKSPPLVPQTHRSTCGFSGDESHSMEVHQQVRGLKVQIFRLCLDDIIEKKGMSARHCCWTSVISVEKKPAYLHWCLKSWRFHHVFHSVGGFGEGSHLCVWSVASYNLSFHTGTDSRLKVVLCIRERLTAGAASVRTASFLTDSKHHSIVLLAFGWMTEWRK